MNCDEALEKLSDHHHETLGTAEAVAVAEHLGACGGCAQAYCRLQAQLRGIGSAYAERPSSGTRDALRAAVQAEFEPKPAGGLLLFLRRPVPAYRALLAAVLPLVAWLAMRSVDAEPADVARPPAPARIHDYGATVPLFDRNVS
ncbi:MAG: zf-HC2 domain-containing protein [Nannocystales bacterium]